MCEWIGQQSFFCSQHPDRCLFPYFIPSECLGSWYLLDEVFSLSFILKWNLKRECTIQSQTRVLWLEMQALGLQGADTQHLVCASGRYLEIREVQSSTLPFCFSAWPCSGVRTEMWNLPFRVFMQSRLYWVWKSLRSFDKRTRASHSSCNAAHCWTKISLIAYGVPWVIWYRVLCSYVVRDPTQCGLLVEPFSTAFSQQKSRRLVLWSPWGKFCWYKKIQFSWVL